MKRGHDSSLGSGRIDDRLHGYGMGVEARIPLLAAGLLATAILFGADGAAAGPLYRITDLGTLGGDFSTATAVNNAGMIVGQARDSHGDDHAVLFNASNPALNVNLNAKGATGSATDINDAGTIVGSEAGVVIGPFLGMATVFNPAIRS